MNEVELTTHLTELGIGLTRFKHGEYRWKTKPLRGSFVPTNYFRNLNEVERHWKAIAIVRLREIEAVKTIGRNEPICPTEIQKLLDWAEGRQLLFPTSLSDAIAIQPSFDVSTRWLKNIVRASKHHGCVAYTWLHQTLTDRILDLKRKSTVCSAFSPTTEGVQDDQADRKSINWKNPKKN